MAKEYKWQCQRVPNGRKRRKLIVQTVKMLSLWSYNAMLKSRHKASTRGRKRRAQYIKALRRDPAARQLLRSWVKDLMEQRVRGWQRQKQETES